MSNQPTAGLNNTMPVLCTLLIVHLSLIHTHARTSPDEASRMYSRDRESFSASWPVLTCLCTAAALPYWWLHRV